MLMNQILEVAKKYRAPLPSPERFLEHAEFPTLLEQLKHCAWMCDEITSGRLEREKAMCWLCFVQGVLWSHGYLDIPSMKDDNRSPESV